MEKKTIQLPETNCSEKSSLEFLNAIIKLDPSEFLGVARMMNISFMRNKAEVEAEAASIEDEAEKANYIDLNSIRPAALITSDMVDKFCEFNRSQRRNLMKIIRAAIK